jgi:hypothetical protein
MIRSRSYRVYRKCKEKKEENVMKFHGSTTRYFCAKVVEYLWWAYCNCLVYFVKNTALIIEYLLLSLSFGNFIGILPEFIIKAYKINI